MTDWAKKEQKKAAKEAGKGFKDSFKDTVRTVKCAGKTLLNATGINGKQKKSRQSIRFMALHEESERQLLIR